MNFLFIGGSNFVIKNGIAESIPRCYANMGYRIDNVYNLSVGGTTSLFGLENLNMSNKRDIDIVFVEYGINDYPLFSNDSLLWSYAYGELLRSLRCRYPKARVVSILLGRKPKRFWERQSAMHSKMEEISREFGALCINIDKDLKSISSSDKFDSLYKDDNHFNSDAIDYIANSVVAKCLLLCNDASLYEIKSNPDFVFDSYTVSGQAKTFENSRMNRKTTVLLKGNSLEIDIKGVPVALSFVSSFDSSSILIESNHGNKIIPTKHKVAGSERFPFLVKQVPLYDVLNMDTDLNSYQKIRLTALDSSSSKWDESLFQKVYNYYDDVSVSRKVYISNISALSLTS
ncbi:SGNH/GDSL hydrolase family protein [Salinivibrio sp. DV]|uniref:SGNH/GDSL hydrolase family protein n=1 Tax=Salinivibrio sp. SS2 TaxID=1892894 RepID=UPI00084C2AA3|nr:SGNH/GDSL hydrolase family protein [Salinivibrio sp. DV]ODP99290.1 hypothetical protein BGK46_11025 [Salinivibrio sp. DV]